MSRPTLWGLHEIAEHYAIRRQLAAKWTTHSAFPAPLAELAQGRVWDAADVVAWGDAHGRRPGAGPGAPRRPAPSRD